MSFFGTTASNRKIEPIPVIDTDFYAEFTMADPADALNITTQFKYYLAYDIRKYGILDPDNLQYSIDGTNWLPLPAPSAGINMMMCVITGATKYYVRQTPGKPAVTWVAFIESEMISCDAMNTIGITEFGVMFDRCRKLKTIPAIDTSNGTIFSQMFLGCHALEYVPYLETSKGEYLFQVFSEVNAMKCLGGLDTTAVTGSKNMMYLFNSTPVMVAPNSAERDDLMHLPGVKWVNPNPCP